MLDKKCKTSIDKIKEDNYKNYFILIINIAIKIKQTNKRKYIKRRTFQMPIFSA